MINPTNKEVHKMDTKTDRAIAEAATDGPWYSVKAESLDNIHIATEDTWNVLTTNPHRLEHKANHVYVAHFNPQYQIQILDERDALREIVKAVAHIGVDFGYGTYVLEQKHIDKAREVLDGNAK